MKKIGNIPANVAFEVYVASLLSHSKNWLRHSSKIELRRLSLGKEYLRFDGVFLAQNGVEKVVVSLLQMTKRG